MSVLRKLHRLTIPTTEVEVTQPEYNGHFTGVIMARHIYKTRKSVQGVIKNQRLLIQTPPSKYYSYTHVNYTRLNSPLVPSKLVILPPTAFESP